MQGGVLVVKSHHSSFHLSGIDAIQRKKNKKPIAKWEIKSQYYLLPAKEITQTSVGLFWIYFVFSFPSWNINLQAKVYCPNPSHLGDLWNWLWIFLFYKSDRQKRKLCFTHIPSTPVWDGTESVKRLVGSAQCVPTSWIPDTEERMLHLGESTGSKRPLLVGGLLCYVQYLALTNHFSFSSFWGGN